jgi:hypothetical protein
MRSLLFAVVVVLLNATPAASPVRLTLCHKAGDTYHLIEVASAAVALAHRRHGDAGIYETVPDRLDFIFGPGCELCPHP